MAKKTSIPSVAQAWCLLAVVALGQLAFAPLMQEALYLSVLLNQTLLLFGLPLLASFLLQSDRGQLFPIRKVSFVFLAYSLLLAFTLDIILEYAVWFSELYFPLPENMNQNLDALLTISSSSDFVGKLALLCLLPAFTEEFCFRGFLQTSFVTSQGKFFGLILTALLFATLHANPWYFHIYLVLGLWFGWLRLISANLLPSILSHFFNNAWTLSLHTAKIEVPLFPEHPSYDLALSLTALAGVILSVRKLWLFSRDFPRI